MLKLSDGINKKIIHNFLSKIKDKNFVLVGHLAIVQYVEDRNPRSIDLLIKPEIDLGINFDSFNETKINLLFTTNDFFKYIYEQESNLLVVERIPVRVASVLSLILMKCYALPALYKAGEHRKADIFECDLKGLLRIYSLKKEGLNILQSFMSQSDFSEVENLCNTLL